MNILIELVLSFFVSYGGVFLIYYVAMAGYTFSGIETGFLEEHFGVFIWCIYLLWMLVLSFLFAIRKYKKVKKVHRENKEKIPRFWFEKKIRFSIAGLLIAPFVWLLINWLSAQEGIFFEFIYMGLITPTILLPPAVAWLALFKD